MEGDHIKINRWLLPFSWLYGLAVIIRNELFELNILKTRRFDIPVISVGNITVGGAGKTPHVEYLIRLLKDKMKVAVLSRGYKRKSRGYVLAGNNTPMREIGDEPYQMKIKFPDIRVAVDKKRCEGIDRLTTDEETKDTDVILLDDAFQHRYVQPGINILLVDYHRLIIYDKLLPAGRLREPLSGKHRADIVIITKCPDTLNPIDYRVLSKAMELYPFQQLYFTKLEYCPLEPIFHKGLSIPLTEIRGKNVLLLTGIASPRQLETDINAYTGNNALTMLSFPDHHSFTQKDIRRINEAFAGMEAPRMIITTEKDQARLMGIETLSDDVKDNIYALPIKVRFMLDKEETFNKKIISYVRKNSRNSILVKREDEHKTKDGNHSGNRPRTISFRDN
ncbi:tetraacyldisaccharide 4'-kinase [Prevotella denticola]|uniref:Tetraacyldisaccharide 4'-kinase n=2 Tax=Prevotella denticola TaxID=28129 RepID=F0H743_9BACT|nr:tetraacyldisaccharide 4'-kinase [Prevotella denticola]EGC86351.1 tetraacyldisaccharide 4'-kinase [Prevotella denticola CRIS 18C-A]MBW4898604.1 tetraacyldisaccharide 4'-kinase [Prevotella denticola]QUI94506.1 tetraacyldisaccharide 4'-kinase [Prevotella denticola]SUB87309.1 Tetraacyldisaccharide 4'-kinase [Prevotella denticola]